MLRWKADSQMAYQRFVIKVAKTGEVWLLDNDGYVAGCNAHEAEASVFPFFSARAYAFRGAKCWEDIFPPICISLDTFIEKLLPLYIERGDFVGPDWDGSMAGKEVPAVDVLEALKGAMQSAG